MFSKNVSQKICRIHREIPVLQPLSNNVAGLQAAKLATLLKSDSRTGVAELAVRRSSAK